MSGLDAATSQRMSAIVSARCAASDEFRLGFVRSVGALFYELVHSNCPDSCVCTTPKGLHNA